MDTKTDTRVMPGHTQVGRHGETWVCKGSTEPGWVTTITQPGTADHGSWHCNVCGYVTDPPSVESVAAGLRARAAGARLRSRLLRDLAEAEERQADALDQYADTLDPSLNPGPSADCGQSPLEAFSGDDLERRHPSKASVDKNAYEALRSSAVGLVAALEAAIQDGSLVMPDCYLKNQIIDVGGALNEAMSS